jgi:hypothetical protein
LQPWLLTPIQNTVDATPQRRYETAFNSARNCIERCIGKHLSGNIHTLTWFLYPIGTLKTRWRCLLKERMLRYHPHKAGVIINACCVLHNICIKGGVPLDEELVQDADEAAAHQNNKLFADHILQEGRRQRDAVINLYCA